MMEEEVTKDSWVRLADGQCGKVVSIQGTRARVQIRGSANMVWREKPLVQLIFKGRPKSTAAVGDYVKLGSDVGVVVGIEGGRVQVEFLEGMLLEGGKKVWREFKDVVLQDESKVAASSKAPNTKPTPIPNAKPTPVPNSKPAAAEQEAAAAEQEAAAAKLQAMRRGQAAREEVAAKRGGPNVDPTPKIALTFRLPFQQEQVFEALISAEAPLGFDTSKQTSSMEVQWHGTKGGKAPADASRLVLGCVRKATFAEPFAGATTSELVALEGAAAPGARTPDQDAGATAHADCSRARAPVRASGQRRGGCSGGSCTARGRCAWRAPRPSRPPRRSRSRPRAPAAPR